MGTAVTPMGGAGHSLPEGDSCAGRLFYLPIEEETLGQVGQSYDDAGNGPAVKATGRDR